MASSSSSSSSCVSHLRYDVFMSFRGEDVRNSFVSHLYEALVSKKIKTFKDDEELEKGREIAPGLLKAIEESRIFIVVLSEGYASSSWCLDELQMIMERKQKCPDLEVIPIFYHVEASEVRHQTGRYKQDLDHLYSPDKKQRLKAALIQIANFSGLHFQTGDGNIKEKIPKWKQALTDIANITGWTFHDGIEPESKRIKKIVEDISSKLVCKQIFSLMELQSVNHVRLVGIYGKAGSGKTIIAEHIYNSLGENFEGHVFLRNIKSQLDIIPENKGLAVLQKQLLKEILKDQNVKVENVEKGRDLIREKLGSKKVFIVLDNVNSKEQLRKLAGNVDWFGSGSRVLITTRNENLLADHGVHWKYEVEDMDRQYSKRQFCLYTSNRTCEKIKAFTAMSMGNGLSSKRVT